MVEPNSQYLLLHRTTFDYAHEVSVSQQLLHLTPRTLPSQRIDRPNIQVTPDPVGWHQRHDYFGNKATFVSLHTPHTQLDVLATSVVSVSAPTVPVLTDSEPWEQVVQAVRMPVDSAALDAALYCHASPYIEIPLAVAELTNDIFTAGRPVFDAVMALTTRINQSFTYQGGVTDVHTPVADVLAMRKGVCQDFAHLQLACLRAMGLAARYVSGYLLTHPPEGQEKLVGADESHAWLSVWSARHGWLMFDPTNNKIPGADYIVLAWGRDYADVTPINGFIIGGGAHSLNVSVDVRPVQLAK